MGWTPPPPCACSTCGQLVARAQERARASDRPRGLVSSPAITQLASATGDTGVSVYLLRPLLLSESAPSQHLLQDTSFRSTAGQAWKASLTTSCLLRRHERAHRYPTGTCPQQTIARARRAPVESHADQRASQQLPTHMRQRTHTTRSGRRGRGEAGPGTWRGRTKRRANLCHGSAARAPLTRGLMKFEEPHGRQLQSSQQGGDLGDTVRARAPRRARIVPRCSCERLSRRRRTCAPLRAATADCHLTGRLHHPHRGVRLPRLVLPPAWLIRHGGQCAGPLYETIGAMAGASALSVQ